MNTETQQDQNTIDGAVTEVKAPDNALVVIDPERYATELFQPFQDQLATAKRRAARATYDVTTKDGMAAAKELVRTFVKIRTSADKAKTEAKRPIDQAGKAILTRFNLIKAGAETEEEKHARVIEAEEARIEEEKQKKIAAERVRIEAIESRIAHIRSLAGQLARADSATLAAKVEEMASKRLDPAMYDEHLDDAVNALNGAVDELRSLHQQALEREEEARRVAAERAELERLRQEQAKRDAEEQERQRLAQQEAAEKERAAQAERDAAAAREADLQRQLAEMRAQLEAQQPKPVAAPVDQAALPSGSTPLADRVPINAEGQYYSTTTFKDNGKPILCNADGTRSIFCDVDDDADDSESSTEPSGQVSQLSLVDDVVPYASEVIRPTDGEIIELLAVTFETSEDTVTGWLRDLVAGLES
jgi:hypothetical protein